MRKYDLIVSQNAPNSIKNTVWAKPLPGGGFTLYIGDNGWQPLKTMDDMDTLNSLIDDVKNTIIQGVKVNGSKLTPSTAANDRGVVDIKIEKGTGNNGTTKINGTNKEIVKGLGTAAYTDTTAYDAAGTAATLIGGLDATANATKTAVNGNTARTLQNGGVFALQSITETDGKLSAMAAIEVEAAGAAAAILGTSDDSWAHGEHTLWGLYKDLLTANVLSNE